MALAPDTSRGHEEDGGSADSEEEVAGQQGDAGKVGLEQKSDGDGIGSENGTEGGRKNGSDGEDQGDEVPFPEGPIEGIVRVVGGLGDLAKVVCQWWRAHAAVSCRRYLTSMMGTSPLESTFKPWWASVAVCGRSGSS